MGKTYRFWFTVFAAFGILSLLNLSTPSRAFAASERILWSFGNGTDGNSPEAGLITDSNGNLYGTTMLGGTEKLGTVFELTPPATIGGAWTESVLWNFGAGTDGSNPEAGLIMDASGNLYGTTAGGGAFVSPSIPRGGGTAFELMPTAGGGWNESVLWSFGNGTDGEVPIAGLTVGKDGNLYGTTAAGGSNAAFGTVFELTRSGGGWSESILWNFGDGASGSLPEAGLILDENGSLFGTTKFDDDGAGAVFALSPPTNGGSWTESILWKFPSTNHASKDGATPKAGLIADSAGDLYGTTKSRGAIKGGGTAFGLTPPSTAGGSWAESILWNFGKGKDGSAPEAGLIMDKSGNLSGTTAFGGRYASSAGSVGGTVFSLKPPRIAGGKWTESILWNFGNGNDGFLPVAALISDASGNLYGTTEQGGTFSSGTVFEIASALTAAPRALHFGNVVAPGTSKPKKMTLINKDTLAADISSVTATAPFTIVAGADTCSGNTIAAKKTCTFEVEFAPTSVGPATGGIDVTYNGTSPSVALTGAGVAPK